MTGVAFTESLIRGYEYALQQRSDEVEMWFTGVGLESFVGVG
jgi:hypothetical protein